MNHTHPMRNAKIVATLGPASAAPERIAELFKAGANVFRLNFSHGSHADHARTHQAIRRLEEEAGRPIGILMDLQGPKLRVGRIAGGKTRLVTGRPFRLDLSPEPGDDARAPLLHPEVFAALAPEMALLLADGTLRLRVVRCGPDFAETEVEVGGELSDHKGVNLPNAVLDISPLTDKDRADLAYGLDLGVDWVALSFVQRADDVAELRKLVGGRAGVLAKLEKPAAIDELYDIVDLADAIMVARGDLGVEVPPEDVPILQKRIIRACRRAGKPVIVATQMLDSMVHSPVPTRAEASDVATAVYDGADAVMLSAETAVGAYAAESVGMMSRIIHRVERDPLYRPLIDTQRREPQPTAEDAISAAARQVAHTISAAAIATFTSTGSTTLRAARERPEVPILGLTTTDQTARRLTLAWGVYPVRARAVTRVVEMVAEATRAAREEGFADTGDLVVVTAGMPFGTPGTTNLLRIAEID
ncbi:pyruvate kinase [Shumkonia mesophila]|uniref:pyruvate kinase n=1 Tax=Shumkonia mesophila TaxID=2838854 RepID=UPI00293452D0|nr:pyruvate kinase [Shumkonia mesophila]